MNIAYITVIVALIFLFVLWIAVGVRHLKVLKKNLASDFEFVDEKVRARHDVIPFLVEVLKSTGIAVPDKIILARDKARRVYFASAEKIEAEHDLSNEINEVIALGIKAPSCAKSPHFLEVKREIEDFNKDIENRTKQYNETVFKFNSARKTLVLRPISMVMKAKQAAIFQFEK